VHNPWSWIKQLNTDIREKGIWAVVISVAVGLVLGVAEHWFYGTILALVESVHTPSFVRVAVIRLLTNPVTVALMTLIALIGALVIHAYLTGRETGLWLEYDGSQPYADKPLRIQNSGRKTVYDVVVKIPADGSDFVSDCIPRLLNDKSWIACTSNGVVETHNATIERLVGAMLMGDLQTQAKPIPVLISFRYGRQKLEIKTPLTHGIKFSLPEPKTKSSGAMSLSLLLLLFGLPQLEIEQPRQASGDLELIERPQQQFAGHAARLSTLFLCPRVELPPELLIETQGHVHFPNAHGSPPALVCEQRVGKRKKPNCGRICDQPVTDFVFFMGQPTLGATPIRRVFCLLSRQGYRT
jgi:hypothetical protein